MLGSAATAGTTGAVVMLTLTLSTLGLPLAGVGLLLAIDPILDMGRTAVNVAGQALVPTIVAKRQGILDEERYRTGAPADPLRTATRDGVDADLRTGEPAQRLIVHRPTGPGPLGGPGPFASPVSRRGRRSRSRAAAAAGRRPPRRCRRRCSTGSAGPPPGPPR